jgi:hypothetical protein
MRSQEQFQELLNRIKALPNKGTVQNLSRTMPLNRREADLYYTGWNDALKHTAVWIKEEEGNV